MKIETGRCRRRCLRSLTTLSMSTLFHVGTLLWSMKENLFVNEAATYVLRVLACANCIETNRLQRDTSRDFFEDKFIACYSKRSEGFHGNYQDTAVRLLSSLLLRAKLIVLLTKCSVSGSFEK